MHSWWACKRALPGGIVWQLLKGLNIRLPYDSAIPLDESAENTHSHKDVPVNIHSHIGVIAKTWKQPQWPSTDD